MDKFGIYIHWPFCLSKCPYCDFASKACRTFDESLMEMGYLRDLKDLPKRPVTSIFFGGGTPSMMSEKLASRLISFIDKNFSLTSNTEITMEANPDAIDKVKMQGFRAAGVNRLSLGVQALNAKDLKFLGRLHSLDTALLRIDEMQSVFDNASIDLIYARPNQTLERWDKELDTALSFGLPHLSLYELTIEEGTPFYKKGIEACGEQTARNLYLLTLEKAAAAWLPLYEVSNFARQGFESRHNLLYWQGDDYAGIGPAAHGRLGLIATENPASVDAWLKNGVQKTELTEQERFEEKIMMGLRLKQGISATGLAQEKINQAQEQGWIQFDPKANRIAPTTEGLLMLNPLTLLLLG